MHIISSYADLPVGKYIDILRANEGDADELDKQVATIAILADKTEDEILALPLTDYAELAADAAFLRESDRSRRAVAKAYHLGGLELVPSADAAKITAGQFIDFQTLTKDGDLDRHLPEILSCLLVPKGKTYGNGYDIADVQAAIRSHLPVSDALALLAFFLTSSEKLLLASLTSSERAAQTIQDREKRATIVGKIRKARKTLLRTAGDGSER